MQFRAVYASDVLTVK